MSTPAINVNLAKCDGGLTCVSSDDECPASPVLIPLSLEPFRSATFEVVLGGCSELCRQYMPNGQHTENCPGRPICVTCSISGKTWEESEVFDIDPVPELWGANANLRAIARERWALVKALVLDMTAGPDVVRADLRSLVQQRDAVFSALANMALAEQAEFREWLSLPDEVKRKCQMDPPDIEHERTPAVESLAAYVEHLIEQVGVLP